METQNKIKDRILRRAAQVWGYTDVELETSFDPIVALLLEACSSELEKISVEIDNSGSRMTERLLEIMSSQDKRLIPSQTVLHLTPIENNYTISLKDQFYCQKIIPNLYNPLQEQVKNIYFGATLPCVLTSAKLMYSAFGNTLYSLERVFHKDLLLKSSKFLQSGTLWLGIKCPVEVEEIEKLMFFTQVRNLSHKEFFYNYLKLAKFYIKDRELSFEEGYNVRSYALDIESVITKNYSQIDQMCAKVNEYYSEQFFHFIQDIRIEDSLFETPEELSEVFDKDKLNKMERILWIKAQFSEVVLPEVFENVLFSINSVPAINKELVIKTHRINPYINYVPLETEDIFLDLDEIQDSQGFRYNIKDFEEGNLGMGHASLRRSGTSRFDERKASEQIQYLLETLKDESASFSVLKGSFIQQNLIKVNQIISNLEQYAKENQFIKAEYPYAIIRPKGTVSEGDMNFFEVSYWTTNGEEANDLKTGTRFTNNNNNFQEDSIVMVTHSAGGKSRLATRDKITSYREALLGKGRVVTFADIKTFCLNHFGESVSKLKIDKGTKVDSSPNKGFVRTIDIKVTRNKDFCTDLQWQYLCDNLLHKLNRVSSNVYPYRLLIE
ncbi:MAG: type VI secretion system baseplate subunit TssF [Flavobacteriaceae bacterium]|nr:type VI secretion system baseplate subunit TssF [Flavobacteriaceae bacterium]